MAIPKPKPDLPDEKWIASVESRICVHIALDSSLRAIPYDIPRMEQPWSVCAECADELDRRLFDWQTIRIGAPHGGGRRSYEG